MKKYFIVICLVSILNVTSGLAAVGYSALDKVEVGPWSTMKGITTDNANNLYTALSVGWNSHGKEAGLIRRSQDNGQSWQTILEIPGCDALGVIASPNGRIFAVTVCDSSTWETRVSSDHGDHWQLVNQATPPASFENAWGYGALTFDANSNLLMTSMLQDRTATRRWIFRKGSPDGTLWQDEDLGAGMGFGLAVSPNGDQFVVGEQDHPEEGDDARHWVVKKKAHGNSNWVDVDDFVGDSVERVATPTSIAIDANGVIYVAGSYFHSYVESDNSAETDWLIRRSLDGGTTWENFELIRAVNPNDFAEVRALGFDSVGRLLVAGSGPGNKSVLRRLNVSGVPQAEQWSISQGVSFGALAIDPLGRVFLAGALQESDDLISAVAGKVEL